MNTDKPELTLEEREAIRKEIGEKVREAMTLRHEPTDEDRRRAEDAYDRLVKTRVKLLLDHPFFGSLATRLEIKEADFYCSMATDGEHQFYNTDFVLESDDDFLIFGMANNVAHLIFDHMGRRGDRQPKAWNIATDIIVNDMLLKAGFKLPENVLYDSRFDSETQTSEQVYDIILPEVEAGKIHYYRDGNSVLVETTPMPSAMAITLDDAGEPLADVVEVKDQPEPLDDDAKRRVENSNAAVERARNDPHLRKFAPDRKIKG